MLTNFISFNLRARKELLSRNTIFDDSRDRNPRFEPLNYKDVAN